MMPLTVLLRAVALAAALSLTAGPALAQYTGYDANCDPRNYTSDEQIQQELCMAHIGCRLTTKAANSACKVKDFFSSLSSALGGRSTPDNYDVAAALNRIEVPQTSGVKQTNAAARPYYEGARVPSYDRSNAAQVDWQQAFYGPPQSVQPVGQLLPGANGALRWREGLGGGNGSGAWSGSGVEIDSKGDIKAGTQLDNNLNGNGIRRAADGSWASGNFDAGALNGQGYTLVPEAAAKAPVMEGAYLNGQPDGMMLVTWPDFSSRKELWQGGKLIAAGAKVPKGQTPVDPKSPEEEAEEKAAAADAKFAAELSAITSAGGLYALGDEWAEKGDMDKARKAWRDMIRRFPDSPLAASAADRLATSSAKPAPEESGAKSERTSSGEPGDWASCDSSAYSDENQANEDYYMDKALNTGSGGYGGSRDTYKYMYLKNRKSLEILDRHKACNEPHVYAEWRKYFEDTMNVALQNCMATSSDGGQGCTRE